MYCYNRCLKFLRWACFLVFKHNINQSPHNCRYRFQADKIYPTLRLISFSCIHFGNIDTWRRILKYISSYMKYRFICLAAFSGVSLLLFSTTSAQNLVTDSTTEIVPYWKKGDKKMYEIKNIREKYFNNQLVYKTTITSKIELSVLDETDTTYLVQWRYVQCTANESDDPIVRRWTALTEGMTIIYRTSETGVVDSICNFAEILTHLEKSLKQLLTTHDSDSVYHRLNRWISRITVDKSIADIFFAIPIRTYHLLHGAEYSLHAVTKIIDTLIHPYTHQITEEITTVKLTNIDSKEMYAKAVCHSETLCCPLLKITEWLSEKNNYPPPSSLEKDTATYIYDLLHGWLIQVHRIQISSIRHIKQKDHLHMTLLR